MATIAETRAAARGRAAREGISFRDVDLLLSDALGRELIWLLAHDEEGIGEEAARLFDAAITRRIAGEPMQYVRGHCEFYGRDFVVDDRVLIPRPETELLVERVLGIAPREGRIVDIGVGSGCIAITLAAERPDLRVAAVDLSPAALAVAKRNATRLGARVAFAASDLLSACRGTFDVIVSNPPYVAEDDRDVLQREVAEWEPDVALFAGALGMSVIERLLADAWRLLEPGGSMVLEIGYGQGELLEESAAATGWELELHPDLVGIQRVAVMKRR